MDMKVPCKQPTLFVPPQVVFPPSKFALVEPESLRHRWVAWLVKCTRCNLQ